MIKGWQYFQIGNLFPDIYKAKAYNAQDLIFCPVTNSNAIRYITRTDVNNGCKGFVQNINYEDIELGNAITIGDTTSTIYYQNEKFICGDHIVILRAPFLNKLRGLFIVSLLSKERFRYNYGRSFKMDIIKNTRILLPSIDKKTPDWENIEHIVINNILPKLPSRTRSVFQENYNKKSVKSIIVAFNDVKWDWFKVEDIFTSIEKCKCSSATELLEDGTDIAYIGAKKSDNGVMKYVKYDKTLITKGNCIVFIGDGQGSVGYSIYQPNDFIASTTLVAGYNPHLNQYIAQFLITILDLERYRYSFGRKYNKSAIANTRIKLPIKTDGTPNWEFMENYIKSIPYSANI